MSIVRSKDQKPVICLGVVVADLVGNPVPAMPDRGSLVLTKDMRLFPGGGVPNTGTTLSRLGVPVSAVGRIGRDFLGDFLEDALEKEGIDTRWVIRDPIKNSSSSMVMVDAEGERSIIHYIGANGNLVPGDISDDAIAEASFLHVAYAFVLPGIDGDPLISILRRAKHFGVTTVLDTAWDASGRWLDLISKALPFVDYFVPNLAEARAMTECEKPGEIAKKLIVLGVATVVLKMNDAGCLAMNRSGLAIECPAYRVDVIDSTGAGDSFNAGLIAGLWYGWSLEEALRLANSVGALCVAGHGAAGKVQSLEHTMQFMREREPDSGAKLIQA